MKFLHGLMISVLLAVGSGAVHGADETFKPFVLASVNDGTLEAQAGEVISALKAAGFEVVGQYRPMEGTHILVATHEALKTAAAQSDRGGYAAGQRISLTETGNGIEVGFVNPLYIQHAYRLDADLGGVYRQLADALGEQRACGAGDKKMTAGKLQKYNYMIGMQKFDDPSELGRFGSYEEAVAAVEQGLAREGDGLSQVYRIDIPGKQQTVFGVGMRSVGEDDEHIDETYQMGIVDFEGCSKKAYLPYEVLVNGNEVEALHMRFRMAVHFPNLSMMGKHGFTKLMPFPGAIEDALEAMVSEP
jgi:hypothetical protein